MKPTETNSRLDGIISRLTGIEVTLGKQHVSLESHMRRTELLEEFVEEDRKEWRSIHSHITQVRFFALLVVLTLGGLGSVFAYLKA